jgi:hypothetical protein
MLPSDNRTFLNVIAAVSFFITLLSPSFSFSQTSEPDAVFILRGITRLSSGKAAERVSLELTQNEKPAVNTFSGKNGKYYIEMEISTLNKNNEHVLYISQAGFISKSITINTYIPPDEYSANTFPTYLFDLEIKMIEKTGKDIVLEGPAGKIKWDISLHAFTFEQSYAKIIHQTEANPDEYIAVKNKKKELDQAIKPAEADAASKKQSTFTPPLEQKQKKDTDQPIQQENGLSKQKIRKKNTGDSLGPFAEGKDRASVAGPGSTIKSPVLAANSDTETANGLEKYSIGIAKTSVKMTAEKRKKEKFTNLSAKYETNNRLTSLLNAIDEEDKAQKYKTNLVKQ